MTPQTLFGALAQVVVFVVVGWIVGDRLLRRIGNDLSDVGLSERALAAYGGFVAFSVALMLGNIITGGVVFGIPGVVPALALAVIVYGVRRVPRPSAIPWLRVLAAVAVLSALFIAPGVIGGSSVRTGDDPWHLGWTEQLLHGLAVPVGPAPVDANAYPWGFHAVLATMTRSVPGTDPLIALEAMNMLLVFGIPIAAAALAKRLEPRAGWAAGAAASLIGGFGWVLARGPAFSPSPRHPGFGADLVAASPNGLYELFPPPLPRELGLVLLGLAGYLMIVAARHARREQALGAGVAAGLVGLVSVPMFVSALAWMAAVSCTGPPRGRLRLFATQLVPALAVFALWAGPVSGAFVRYGGFVNITPHLGMEWPLPTSLMSWGLLLPLALAGIVAALVIARDRAASPAVLFAGSVALLVLSLARSAFDWGLEGNATLLHQGRVWPPLHLLGAGFAGAALVWGAHWVNSRRRLAGSVLAAGIVAAGMVSPALASVQMTRIVADRSDGFVFGSADLDHGSFVRRVAARLGPSDVVAVRGPAPMADELGFTLFELSGTRLATFDNPKLEGDDLRIRYRDLAERWNEQIADGGYQADFVVAPPGTTGTPLIRGTFGGEEWELVAVTR